MASSSAHISLIPSPKTLLAVHSGLWRGKGVITINKHSITHTLSVCIKDSQNYIARQTGAQLYGGYFPPTCKVHIIANKTDRLVFLEVCVPSQFIHAVINHSVRVSNLMDLPAYLFKRYEITSNRGGFIQVNVRKSEKRPSVHSKRRPKSGSGGATKYFSQDIHGTFHYVSSTCPYPIKVPTNKELRAEGKSVKRDHDLSEKLKSKLGYDPFPRGR
jgi:hypothetical protein